ncbi:MAG: 1-acyl-sn-glycerol-3-phosphate acyltransferase [Pseudomonadota bacterium]
MFGTVEIPVWLLWVAGLLAAIAALDRIIGPGIRWFLRRRMERALSRVNARLERKIEPFKLARRQDMIVRLLYDARVLEAVSEHAAETHVPGSVAFEEARRYAREIVPGFSATLYFGFATRAAKAFSRMLYRVRVGKVDAALAHIDPRATVIFVMNHRSNMDYVLVTWLVADRSAISYAVGEWARVWPLSAMIRAMGAYFIRRGNRNALYRKVLARYVQMATEDGTTQAIFPEGGLSLDGRVGPARMGLLSYIVQGFEPGGRDVVFVPVGLGYDRVLEDRVLVAAAAEGGRRFRNRPLRVLVYAVRMLWNRFCGRFKGFGTAAAGFGAPVSLRAFLAAGNTVETLGETLMARIASVVPVLPVPLVAAALGDGAASREELRERVEGLISQLQSAGAVLKLPPQGIEATLDEGLTPLIARGLVGNDLQPVASGREVLRFYAASVPTKASNAALPQT